MTFSITGLNHRTAPVSIREQLAFDAHALPVALQHLRRQPGVAEGLILSTCNRVEVVVSAADGADTRGVVEEFLADQRHMDRHALRQYLYQYQDRDAIRHLFRVAASLDSMVVGEPQILGQLKTAYALAKEHGALDSHLDLLLTRAFNVAKRVRSETEIGSSAVSISYAAVELAREIFGSLQGKRVLLVGAGKMSELAARHLQASGATDISVTNRTAQRAEDMARLFHGRLVDYASLHQALPQMDIVITSSGAPEPVIRKDAMRRVIEARRNRPMFLIDIAVPRNVEPQANELDNVFVYDIDDLQKVVEANLHGRLREAEQADLIITEEVERVEAHLRSRQVVPTIVELQDALERIRAGEIQRMRGKLGSLTPQQEEALEALTRGIVNKLAHGPITELRRSAATGDSLSVLGIIRRAFRLERS